MAELEKRRDEHINDADPTIAMIADLDIWSAVGAGELPADKVARDRAKYFSDMTFRTIDDVLATTQDAGKS